MNTFCKKLNGVKILPVVCIKSKEELNTFMEALLKTPIRCVEITLRHPFALEAIKFIKESHPEITVGAGTVVTKELFKTAIKSGADFFVSPGFDKRIIKMANRKGLLFLPGVSTPTEILIAKNFGLKTLKLFPAECSGGVNLLNLYKGAFPDVNFIPTGGITVDNLASYTFCDNVVACGGSFMVPKMSLENGNVTEIVSAIENCIQKTKESSK